MKDTLELINQIRFAFCLGAVSKKISGEMMDKIQWRKQIAALSFSEKIKILERLRARSLAIAASGLRNVDQLPRPSAERKSKL